MYIYFTYRLLVSALFLLSMSIYNIFYWPSKTDFAPVRGDGYEPGSSKFRLRANAKTLHSVQ